MEKLRDLGRAALLCLIGGSADAIAYLRFGTFVGAMSGNTVLLGIDLAGGRAERALYHAAIIAVFFAAIIATRTAVTFAVPRAVPLFLTAIMLAGSQFIPGPWGAALSAAALGMQTSAVLRIGGVSINTVFVTGDLVRLGMAVPLAAAPEHRNRMLFLGAAWTAYAAGAVGGAAALKLIAYPMAVPAVLALIAAVVER